MLTENKASQYYIGFDIGGTKLAVVLADLNYNIKRKKISSTIVENKQKPYLKNLNLMFQMLESILEEEYLGLESIRSIGISCGGPLNSKKGIILSPPNLPSWDNVEIVSLFEDRYHIKTYLQNDANAGALAECLIGYKGKYKNMIFLTFGTGMGAGIIIDGKIYSGVSELAGEVGHWRLTNQGPWGFGKEGSFEGYCSGGGISKLLDIRLKELNENELLTTKLKPRMSAQDIALLAKKEDQLALKIYEEVGTMLGRGLAMLIDVLNPEAIVLGSIYFRARKLLEKSMYQELHKECLAESLNACDILESSLGENIGDYASLIVASHSNN